MVLDPYRLPLASKDVVKKLLINDKMQELFCKQSQLICNSHFLSQYIQVTIFFSPYSLTNFMLLTCWLLVVVVWIGEEKANFNVIGDFQPHTCYGSWNHIGQASLRVEHWITWSDTMVTCNGSDSHVIV